MWNFNEEYDDYLVNPDLKELNQRLDDAGEWFEEVTDILYGKKAFNLIDLENALDELGSYLKRKIPLNELKLKKDEEVA